MTELETLRDKVRVYEGLLHYIQGVREVAMNHEKTSEVLNLIGDWSYAHRMFNGVPSPEEQQALVDVEFEKIRNLVHGE